MNGMESTLTMDWSAGRVSAWVFTEAEGLGEKVSGFTTVEEMGEVNEKVTEVLAEVGWMTRPGGAAWEELDCGDVLLVDTAAVLVTGPGLLVWAAVEMVADGVLGGEIETEGLGGLVPALAA